MNTAVRLDYARPEAMAHAEALIRQSQLMQSLNLSLKETLLYYAMGEGRARCGTRSHDARLDLGELQELLIGHQGMGGEYGNGIGQGIANLDLALKTGKSLEKGIDMLLPFADKESQLTKNFSNQKYGDEHQANALAVKVGIRKETALGSLERVARMIEAWVQHNEDALPKDTGATLLQELALYRDQLAEAAGHIDYLRGYRAQMEMLVPKKKLMIVDDDADQLVLLMAQFSKLGYAVTGVLAAFGSDAIPADGELPQQLREVFGVQHAVSNETNLRSVLERLKPDAVLSDYGISTQARINGKWLVQQAKQVLPDAVYAVHTHGDRPMDGWVQGEDARRLGYMFTAKSGAATRVDAHFQQCFQGQTQGRGTV